MILCRPTRLILEATCRDHHQHRRKRHSSRRNPRRASVNKLACILWPPSPVMPASSSSAFYQPYQTLRWVLLNKLASRRGSRLLPCQLLLLMDSSWRINRRQSRFRRNMPRSPQHPRNTHSSNTVERGTAVDGIHEVQALIKLFAACGFQLLSCQLHLLLHSISLIRLWDECCRELDWTGSSADPHSFGRLSVCPSFLLRGVLGKDRRENCVLSAS